MKFRRMVCWVMALALLMGAMALAGCSKGDDAPQLEAPQETVPTLNEDGQPMRDTVLYFVDDNHYVLPVMQPITWQEGIGKAALECLVAGTEQDGKLGMMGISAPIPAGTKVELDIAEGTATVNLIFGDNTPKDAKAEGAMVACIVNTLLEFPSVEGVKIRVNGQDLSTLPSGTDISKVFKEKLGNVEPSGAPASTAGKTDLYFVNQTGNFLVPVQRVLGENETPVMAAQELVSPAEGTSLVSLLPPNCQITGVAVSQDGTATVNVSEEFLQLSATPSMEQMAVRGLTLTMEQFDGVEQVSITVNGKPYQASTTTMAEGGYLNTMN